jgi:hypothetical protein
VGYVIKDWIAFSGVEEALWYLDKLPTWIWVCLVLSAFILGFILCFLWLTKQEGKDFDAITEFETRMKEHEDEFLIRKIEARIEKEN